MFTSRSKYKFDFCAIGQIVDDIFRVRGWSAAKPILCDLPYSDRTEYYSARYSIRNSNE